VSRFRDFNNDSSESISLNELKRKEPELEMETPPSRKLPKTTGQSVDGQSSSHGNVFGQRTKSNNRGKGKGKGKGKLDYNLLRQQKSK
jgi:M-phase phosphoprotein-6